MKIVAAINSSKQMDELSNIALDAAISMKDANGIVVSFSLSSSSEKGALKETLALGVDEAYLLHDKSFQGSDAWAYAKTISTFILKFVPDFDIIVFASDPDVSDIPAELAYMLGAEQFYYVTNVKKTPNGLEITQDYGDETRVCVMNGKSVIVVSKNSSKKHVFSESKKEIKELNRIDLGLGVYSVGAKGSKIIVVREVPQ